MVQPALKPVLRRTAMNSRIAGIDEQQRHAPAERGRQQPAHHRSQGGVPVADADHRRRGRSATECRQEEAGQHPLIEEIDLDALNRQTSLGLEASSGRYRPRLRDRHFRHPRTGHRVLTTSRAVNEQSHASAQSERTQRRARFRPMCGSRLRASASPEIHRCRCVSRRAPATDRLSKNCDARSRKWARFRLRPPSHAPQAQ